MMYHIEKNISAGRMLYPPWVMEHKKKGRYVNKINGTIALVSIPVGRFSLQRYRIKIILSAMYQ